MDYVVIDLDLVQFLEREGEFAGTRLVGTETVFVETVEDLMIGEEADMRLVVDKPLVESGVDGSERYPVATVGEYGSETFGLVRGV